MNLDSTIREAHTALNSYSDSEDINAYTVCMLFIIILNLVVIGAITIKFGFHNRYVAFLATILIALIYYRWKMGQVTEKNLKDNSYTNIDPNDKRDYAIGLLRYLSSGFEVKIMRVSLVRTLYVLLTPLIAVGVYDFCFDTMSLKRLVISLGVLLPISYLMWNSFFKSDLEVFSMHSRSFAAQADSIAKA